MQQELQLGKDRSSFSPSRFGSFTHTHTHTLNQACLFYDFLSCTTLPPKQRGGRSRNIDRTNELGWVSSWLKNKYLQCA